MVFGLEMDDDIDDTWSISQQCPFDRVRCLVAVPDGCRSGPSASDPEEYLWLANPSSRSSET